MLAGALQCRSVSCKAFTVSCVQPAPMIGSGCSSGDGHTDEDDAAYARRLQDEADREHYARLIDGHGTLEAALQGGVTSQVIWPVCQVWRIGICERPAHE